MIEFKQVSKRYPTTNEYALKDLSFQISEGEFVFMIGHSGSGKTTVMRMLIREEKPSEGKIFFDDSDITKFRRSKVYQLRRMMGVVFQDYKLIAHKNVYENVAFAMEVAGQKRQVIKETVPYMLEIVGLPNKANSFPNQLSGGEQQRVAIARAIANSPRVLLADEPTGNLDPGAAWDIVQILNKINAWGTTVIMSTHGTDIVNSLNKRVIQLKDGAIIRDDSKGQYELTAKDFSEKMLKSQGEAVEQQQSKNVIKVDLKTEKISERLKNRKKEQKPEVEEEVVETEINEPLPTAIIDEPTTVVAEVVTNAVVEPVEVKSSRFPFISLIKPFKVFHRDEPEVTPEESTENLGLARETEITETENIVEKIDADISKLNSSSSQQITKDAAVTSVQDLDIPEELAEKLIAGGFEQVSSIIDAGPDKLVEDNVIDPIEVIELSQAISEFVDVELETVGDDDKAARTRGKSKVKKKPKKKLKR